MNAARALGDWTRVGIILSVVWILASASYFSRANQEAYWQRTSKDCLALQKASPAGFNLLACGAYNRAQWQIAREHAWEGVALRSLGPIPLGWLIAYGCGWLLRRTSAKAKAARK